MSTAPQRPEPLVELVDVEDTDDGAAPEPVTVGFYGQRFPIGDQPVPLLSLMKLATIAKRQRQQQANGQQPDPVDAEESMAILYELVRAMIVDAAWPRFEDHANTVGADVDDFQRFIQDAVAARGTRPTRQPSGSPGGRSTTAPSSAGGSSSPGSSVPMGSIDVQHEYEQRGRADLALVVKRAREASTTS